MKQQAVGRKQAKRARPKMRNRKIADYFFSFWLLGLYLLWFATDFRIITNGTTKFENNNVFIFYLNRKIIFPIVSPLAAYCPACSA